MAFANLPVLLFGGLSVAVPIILHLIMRRRPVHQPFPAMQFLRKRKTVNTRRLRVRQFLLLALRCAMLLLVAAAFARPSVATGAIGSWVIVGLLSLLTVFAVAATLIGFSSGVGRTPMLLMAALAFILATGTCYSAGKALRDGGNVLLGDRAAPVAAAILIDTSPRMDLRNENENRLERAQRMANWLVRQLPSDSDVAVFDAKQTGGVFAVDLGSALNAINKLEVDSATITIPQAATSAVQLLADNAKVRKELYIFTDRTKRSWTQGDERLKELLASEPNIKTYIIDVGVEDPVNTAIDTIQLRTETLSTGSSLNLRAKVLADGPTAEHTVSLIMEAPTDQRPIIVNGVVEGPEETVRGKQSLVLDQDSSQWASFTVSGLPVGLHHGYVQLGRDDALEVDNQRYFTIEVRKPWRVFVASSSSAVPEFLMRYLAPLKFQAEGLAKYEFTEAPLNELGSETLSDHDIVCLLDPSPLPSSTWKRLERFVRRGGGLAIFLGREATAKFNSEAALGLLPAAINRQWRDNDGLFLAPKSASHGLLKPFQADDITSVPWDALPVFRHWGTGNLQDSSNVVVSFSNNQPAILERVVGEGRVVMMTTPVSDDANLPGRPAWNLIPIGTLEGSWPFMMLADGTMTYLAETESHRLNYDVNQTAVARVPKAPTAKRYQLFKPNPEPELNWQEMTATNDRLEIGFSDLPGTYRIYDDDGDRIGGFSVNLPAGATQLDRMTEEQMDEVLGEGRYQVAVKQSDIVREVDESRAGSEFYPFLMIALAVVMGLEHLIANRFYGGG